MSDDTRELKELAEQNIHLFLQVDGSGKGYICPVCQSGSGKKGTGLHPVPNEPGYYKCFACGKYADILDWGGGIPEVRKTLENAGVIKPKTQSTHNTHTTQNMYNTQNTHNDIKDPVKEKAEQIPQTHENIFLYKNKPLYDIKKAWAMAFERAGIPYRSFHTLRHTTATWLLRKTNNLRIVQNVLGHSNINVTTKYAHLVNNESQTALEVLFDK